MSASYRSGGRRGLGLLCAAALILGPMALAGCGSIAAPGSSAAAPGSSAAADAAGAGATGQAVPARLALCADPAAADHVVIARSTTLRVIQPEHPAQHIVPPVQVTVTSGPRVRALAEALCALPRMPAGTLHCPALLIGSYRLKFTAARRHLPVVTIQATGCETVTGLGQVRSISRSPAFWIVLAKAAGPFSPLRPPALLPFGPAGQRCTPSSTTRLSDTHCPGRALPGGASHS